MITPNSLDSTIYNLFEFRPRKGDLKKLEIVKAAIECLAVEGPENMTYEAIAKRLNTRRAHIAYHFSDKSDIYLTAVKYILATAQQITIDSITKAETGKEMLENYIDSYFSWAEQNPQQLTVMLLFYYLCPLKDEYRELHSQIRKAGFERLVYILTTRLEKRLPPTVAAIIASDIQSLITGSMIDAYTTREKDMKKAQRDIVARTWQMIEDAK